MTTRLHLRCDGCYAETHTASFKKRFESANGRGYGFGVWLMPDIDAEVLPTGWVWSDPYTSCTYCPECWKEIEVAGEEKPPREEWPSVMDAAATPFADNH